MSTVQRTDTVADRTPLSMEVIDAIAAQADVDPVDLDTPLYEVIDLDALDALTTGAPESATVEITFQYEGYDVHVTGDREIRIDEQ